VKGLKGSRVSLMLVSTEVINILSELNKSAWSLPYSSVVLPSLS